MLLQIHRAQHCRISPAMGSAGSAWNEDAAQSGTTDPGQEPQRCIRGCAARILHDVQVSNKRSLCRLYYHEN